MGEGAYCHKPATVSGGGKSEISKSLNDAVIYASMYVGGEIALLDISLHSYHNYFLLMKFVL